MNDATEMCHCGRPLHYKDPDVERIVREMIDRMGRDVTITASGRSWKVPRHYIALHGIRATDLPNLGFRELKRGGHGG